MGASVVQFISRAKKDFHTNFDVRFKIRSIIWFQKLVFLFCIICAGFTVCLFKFFKVMLKVEKGFHQNFADRFEIRGKSWFLNPVFSFDVYGLNFGVWRSFRDEKSFHQNFKVRFRTSPKFRNTSFFHRYQKWKK